MMTTRATRSGRRPAFRTSASVALGTSTTSGRRAPPARVARTPRSTTSGARTQVVGARRLGPSGRLSSGARVVVRLLGPVYPEVKMQADRTAEVVRSEEERFAVALRQGMERLQPSLERRTLNPHEVFYLHDTLGFP